MAAAPIVVLGTGMAGIGAGYALQSRRASFLCFDKNRYAGGHTRSIHYQNGFLFDEGPHISFTKNERMQQLLAESIDHAYEERRLPIDNYWRGHRIPHPVQCHLHGLPVDLTAKVIEDFVMRDRNSRVVITQNDPQQHRNARQERVTYADWLYGAYGATFAETFPMVYGKKYHTTEMENLTTDWIGPRMYQLGSDELIRGALQAQEPDKHYIQTFRYPLRGGFGSYIEAFVKAFDVRLNHRLVQVEPREKKLHFSNGHIQEYSACVSSIPLPDLIPMIAGVPDSVLEQAKRLAFSSVVLVNIGLDRRDISDAAVTYFYDEDVVFSRLSLPHMFARSNAPEDCGSLQAEIYFSDKYRPLTTAPESFIQPVIDDLRRCGFIKHEDKILMADAVVSRYANVIYDFDRATALSTIHRFLDDQGIRYCGRFGRWDHSWTDESFLSGESSAKQAFEEVQRHA